MKKDDLRALLKTSPATIAKMGKNEYVSMKIIDDICNELNCEVNDVIQHTKEKERA
jgi:DNA-binding Xre family transcriptional regulator